VLSKELLNLHVRVEVVTYVVYENYFSDRVKYMRRQEDFSSAGGL
jgi:hypothetical protein